MINLIQGNIFDDNSEALVNTVNCFGVMGKGIALEFKKRFPLMFEDYKIKCLKKEIKVGKVDVFFNGSKPKYIINFPTKIHWKNPSNIEWIKSGLLNLVHVVKTYNIQTIAMPALGCQNGQLKFDLVLKYIKYCFENNKEVNLNLYVL